LHNDYFRILYTSKGTANLTVHLFDLEDITGERVQPFIKGT